MSDYLTTLGSNSKTTILHIEADKLSIEFEAAATVKTGQPVKMDATGKVVPWLKADALNLLIGYVYNDGVNGDLVTVFTRAFMLAYGLSSELLSCATPITHTDWDNAVVVDEGSEQDGTTGYNRWEQAGGDTACAWTCDAAAAADELIKVMYMH